MPVYIRSGELDVPAPSVSSLGSDDEADSFIVDPEQIFDDLPLPYRMLDKFLNQVLDETWEIIVARQQKREEEARTILPPVYQASSTVEEFENQNCCCHSDDDRYIFVGFSTGALSAFDSASYGLIAAWNSNDFNACFERMTCAVIGPDVHLIAAVDDMGFAYLFMFVNEAFTLVQLMNEQPEGSPKSNAAKFNLSKHGDFCGLALECEDSSWLDIYRLPRDTWLREIETTQKESLKRAQTSSESITASNSAADVLAVPSGVLDYKFSPMTLVLKVKGPTPLVGNSAQVQQDNMEKVGLPNTVGNGTTHLISQNHLDIRRAMIKNMYEELQPHDVGALAPTTPTWHFLNPSRMQPETMGYLENVPVSVCVWWKNSHLAQIYPIHLQGKNVKDVEQKPDLVWPMCGVITSSTASDCTNILAFGLESGLVSVVDRYLCIPRGMVHVGHSAAVREICILDASLTNSPSVISIPPPMYCLIGLGNGAVVFLDCSLNQCKTIVPPSCTSQEQSILISPLHGATQVFLYSTETTGCKLCETMTGKVVCRLGVAESLEDPNSRFSFSLDGGVLFVKNDDATVHTFMLRDYSLLDEYRHGTRLNVPSLVVKETIEARCQRLLTERISKQSKRTNEMVSRWRSLKKELSVLMNSKLSDSGVSSTTATSPSSGSSRSIDMVTSRLART